MRLIKSGCTILLSATLLLFCRQASGTDDSQYWNTFIVKSALDNHWSLDIGSDQKFVDDLDEFGIWTLFAAPYYKVHKHLSLGFEYRHQAKKTNGLWQDENRFTPVIILRHPLSLLHLTFRERLEYRSLETDDYVRSRNYIKASLQSKSFSPWISNEFFYDFDRKKINQNRLSFGVKIPIMKSIEADLYCMYKSDKKNDSWRHITIAGTTLIFLFPS